MDDIYEWLYEQYARPQMRDMEDRHHAALAAFAERLQLSKHPRRCLPDLGENMRLDWGTEAFFHGVQFGLRLSDTEDRPQVCAWLTDFLPQLDDPVS